MIITGTMNPAVDKTYQLDELKLGEVNRIQSFMRIAGGKGINVAKVLKQLEDLEDLNYWEDYYIMKYNSYFPEGYNKRWNTDNKTREEIEQLLKIES